MEDVAIKIRALNIDDGRCDLSLRMRRWVWWTGRYLATLWLSHGVEDTRCLEDEETMVSLCDVDMPRIILVPSAANIKFGTGALSFFAKHCRIVADDMGEQIATKLAGGMSSVWRMIACYCGWRIAAGTASSSCNGNSCLPIGPHEFAVKDSSGCEVAQDTTLLEWRIFVSPNERVVASDKRERCESVWVFLDLSALENYESASAEERIDTIWEDRFGARCAVLLDYKHSVRQADQTEAHAELYYGRNVVSAISGLIGINLDGYALVGEDDIGLRPGTTVGQLCANRQSRVSIKPRDVTGADDEIAADASRKLQKKSQAASQRSPVHQTKPFLQCVHFES